MIVCGLQHALLMMINPLMWHSTGFFPLCGCYVSLPFFSILSLCAAYNGLCQLLMNYCLFCIVATFSHNLALNLKSRDFHQERNYSNAA